MKIGIDYRMLGMGPATMNRGMGRYTQQQLREVLRLDHENEYLLLCRKGSDTTVILPEIVKARNVRISQMPSLSGIAEGDPNSADVALKLSEELQQWLDGQGLDVYHATTPFLLGDLVVPFIDVCPVLVTHYDLIPFVFPRQYFGTDLTSVSREAYLRAVRFVSRADQVIAISEYVRTELNAYLGVPLDRIQVGYPIADPIFEIWSEEAAETTLEELRGRLGLVGDFVLSVSHFHYSKNLPLIFRAYGRLPSSVRDRFPLVLACQLRPEEKAFVRKMASREGIERSLVLTDLVKDEELVALYNRATIFVHPSRYEGFGLPVLEAMHCGTAVITTTAASVPEVGGDAALLVDPDDAEQLARAMNALIESPEQRSELQERAASRARQFSPEQLGEATLAAYRRVHETPRCNLESKPRIALWSPLPPQQSGISDYTAELLGSLTRAVDVEVFVDDGYLPSGELFDLCYIHHHSAFKRRHRTNPFDLVIYELGASFFHLFIESALLTWGGVVVLHDLTWGFIRHALACGGGDSRAFVQELRRVEGREAAEEFAAVLEAPEAERSERLEDFLNRHYLLGPIVKATDAQVVHMPRALEEILEVYPDARPILVPMGVADPIEELPPESRAMALDQLGLTEIDLIVGTFGIVDPVKRVDKLIEAVASLGSENLRIALLIVGPVVTESLGAELKRKAARLKVADRVRLLGRVSDQEFDRLLDAVDVVVNLRFPFRKQLSAALLRGVAAGKPVVITDLQYWDFLPEDFCLRVVPDRGEVERLKSIFRELIENPPERERMAERAREYYVREATVADMRDGYLRVLERLTGIAAQPRTLPSREAGLLPLNKLYDIEDISEKEFAANMSLLSKDTRSPSTAGIVPPRVWAAALSLAALNRCEALSSESSVLCVGLADRRLLGALSDEAATVRVVPACPPPIPDGGRTRLFRDKGREAGRLMLDQLDPVRLPFREGQFDSVIVGPEWEMADGVHSVANVMHEVGRVLKEGGIATVAIPFSLFGPRVNSTEGPAAISSQQIDRFVLEAGGLEMVGELKLECSLATMTTNRNLSGTRGREARDRPLWVERGHVLTILHLTLRRAPDAEPPSWSRISDSKFAALIGDRSVRERRASDRQPSVGQRPGASEHPAPGRQGSAQRLWVESDLRSLLNRWDEVRARSALTAPARGPWVKRAIGFAQRSVQRYRDLGIAWDRLRDLLTGIVDHQVTLGDEVRWMAAEVEELREQQRRGEAQVEELAKQQRRADALVATDWDIWILRFMRVVTELSVLLEQPERPASEVLFRLSQELEELRREGRACLPRDTETDLNRLALLTRSVMWRSAGPPELFDNRAARLTRRDAVTLLQSLEAMHSGVATARSIEVSVQELRGDSFLAGAIAQFGDRMSCLDQEGYRSPNDLWIHVDRTHRFDHPTFWESARRRLEPGRGLLVLVTHDADVATVPGFTMAREETLTLESGPKVHVVILVREEEGRDD